MGPAYWTRLAPVNSSGILRDNPDPASRNLKPSAEHRVCIKDWYPIVA
jgi:hypothetical protein